MVTPPTGSRTSPSVCVRGAADRLPVLLDGRCCRSQEENSRHADDDDEGTRKSNVGEV